MKSEYTRKKGTLIIKGATAKPFQYKLEVRKNASWSPDYYKIMYSKTLFKFLRPKKKHLQRMACEAAWFLRKMREAGYMANCVSYNCSLAKY